MEDSSASFTSLLRRRLLDDTAADDRPAETADDSSSDTFAAVLSNVFLFFLIFGLSATVEIKNLKKQLTNRFAIGCGVLMQFLIMPMLGCLSVVIMRDSGLTKAMGIALLVVTSSPGGSYSNWWCSMFNAGTKDYR
jgi:predicted Na+-dependent transporter